MDEDRFSLLLQASLMRDVLSSSSSATICTNDLKALPCATIVIRAANKSSWMWPSFARPSSESSKDEFEVLESSEQSLRAVISSIDLSAVNDDGSDMEAVTIGLAVMSSVLAVASERNTVQSRTYVGIGLCRLHCGGCDSASLHQ